MKTLKYILLIVIFGFLALSCNNLSNDPLQSQSVTATTPTCFSCHGENTVLGNKVQWAQAGWADSVHANGIQGTIYASYWSGAANIWYVAGYEWHGSDAFYSNGGGCQVCHTKEGFLKRVNGDYGTVDWTLASAFLTAINNDIITNPSNLTCFTCHSPHKNGDFTLNVLPTTTVTTQTGALYDKTKGSLCASCHQIRLNSYATANALITDDVVAGNLKSFASYWGSHHGPQTDVLLGKGGAEYPPLVYSNAAHTTNPDANCVNCHMADDFENITDPALRLSLSPAVGGHSMAVVGIVHGAPAANKKGCTFTGCHLAANVTGKVFGAFGAIAADGYLAKNRAYVEKLGGSMTSTDHFAKINGLMKILASPGPTTQCGFNSGGTGGGLLQAALNFILNANVNTQTTYIKWQTMPDGTYGDTTLLDAPTCIHAGFSANIPAAAAGSDTEKFAKALWNFKLVLEDKSMGIHNGTYIMELLYDSCTDLVTMTGAGATYDCSLGGLIAARP